VKAWIDRLRAAGEFLLPTSRPETWSHADFSFPILSWRHLVRVADQLDRTRVMLYPSAGRYEPPDLVYGWPTPLAVRVGAQRFKPSVKATGNLRQTRKLAGL
jgi:hypothetical protein